MKNKLTILSFLALSLLLSVLLYYYFTERVQATNVATLPITKKLTTPAHFKQNAIHLKRITLAQTEPNTDKIITIKQLAQQYAIQALQIQPKADILFLHFNQSSQESHFIKALLYHWPAAHLSTLSLKNNTIKLQLFFPDITLASKSKKHYSHYAFLQKPNETPSNEKPHLVGTLLKATARTAFFKMPDGKLTETHLQHRIANTPYKVIAITLHQATLKNMQTHKIMRLKHA